MGAGMGGGGGLPGLPGGGKMPANLGDLLRKK
jgi:hypothetical protein